jgi:hypothetical protein
MKFSLRAQIEEVEREIILREKVFPRMVQTGKMREAEADYHLARMHAVLETLRNLQDEAVKDE